MIELKTKYFVKTSIVIKWSGMITGGWDLSSRQLCLRKKLDNQYYMHLSKNKIEEKHRYQICHNP